MGIPYFQKLDEWEDIVMVQILGHLFTCHTTKTLIKCPLFLITFDLIYPTFIFLPVLSICQKVG
jgi:hypothetical protein